MPATFQLDYVPNGMFNLFLKQIRGHSHVRINPLREDVAFDFYRISPEAEKDYWACRADYCGVDFAMCPYCRDELCAGALAPLVECSCKEAKAAKAARYDTKDVITFMYAAFLSALCDIAFSGREYDIPVAMDSAYAIDDESLPDEAYADDDEVMPDDALYQPKEEKQPSDK